MSLRIALLGLLYRSGSASGYDLARSVERSITHIWSARHSQIYPELVKMHQDGAIRIEAEGPRGRKIYAITEQGAAEVRDWLLDHRPNMSMRSEWALQAFLLPLLEPDEALGVLERMRSMNRTYLDFLVEMERNLRPTFLAREKPIGKYALDLGIRHARLLDEWAADTAVEICRDAARVSPDGGASGARER